MTDALPQKSPFSRSWIVTLIFVFILPTAINESLENIEIWSIGPDEQARRITGLDQVVAIKSNPVVGYNFFAYRSPSP
jgi:hypothetical protein